MTYKEAIIYAENVHFCAGCGVNEIGLGADEVRNECDKCEHRRFFEIAIDAIGRQIPKKPIQKEETGLLLFDCPSCGCAVGFLEFKEHRCRCGQAIDWEDEE